MLSDEERITAERLFRDAGYDKPLRIAITSEDERVFVVEMESVAELPYDLCPALQEALGRKVWIVAGGLAWTQTIPLR